METKANAISQIQVVLRQSRPAELGELKEQLTRKELLTVLESKKPLPFLAVKPKSYGQVGNYAERQQRLIDHHHFERLNLQNSVRSESYRDGVRLSAAAMLE